MPLLSWLIYRGAEQGYQHNAYMTSALIAMAGLYVVRRKLWRGALVMSGSFLPILALHLYGNLALTTAVIMLWVVGITWFSGLDYLVVGWKQLRSRGDFSRADAVRL